MLHGALAAAVTPLREGGDMLDEEAFAPLMAFLSLAGLHGALVLGTTGEGMLLDLAERRRAAELFLESRPAEFDVAVHCGAQTTRDTASLAAHAAECGADAVAVIAPPYFPLDESSLLGHFRTAASACAPLPFYLYEFAARSGYAVPRAVIELLRAAAPNLRGLKVSDTPFSAVRPYLIAGLDVFVGSEPLVREAMENGAKGAVSGLASAFPEVVAELVHERTPASHDSVSELRRALAGLPFQSAIKRALALRGVPVGPDVRAPLRPISGEELRVIDRVFRAYAVGFS